MNAEIEKVLNGGMPSFHHRHALHEAAKLLIVYWSRWGGLYQGEIQFNPIPFVEQSLIVESKRFIVGDAELVVHKLPGGQVVNQHPVHVKTNQVIVHVMQTRTLL